MAEILVRQRQRGRTAAGWTSTNEVLLTNELGVEEDTGRFKIGDGVTPWNSLPYRDADVVLTAHTAETTGAHGGIVASTDPRLSDQRVPTDGSVTTAKIVDSAVTTAKIADGTIVDADVSASAAVAESKLNLASDAPAGTPSRRTLGTGATQAAAGDDPRLSVTRTLATTDTVLVSDGQVPYLVAVAPEPTILTLPADAVAAVEVGTVVTVICTGPVVVHVGVGASTVGDRVMGYCEPGGEVRCVKTAADTWAVTGVTWPETATSDGFTGAAGSTLAGRPLDLEQGGDEQTWTFTGAGGDWRTDGTRAMSVTGSSLERRILTPVPDGWASVTTVEVAVVHDTKTLGVMLNVAATATHSGYSASVNNAEALRLYTWTDGVFTAFAPPGSGVITAGQRYGLGIIPIYDTSGVRVSNRLLLLLQGAVVQVVDDSTHLDTASAGLHAQGLDLVARYDNFRMEVLR